MTFVFYFKRFRQCCVTLVRLVNSPANNRHILYIHAHTCAHIYTHTYQHSYQHAYINIHINTHISSNIYIHIYQHTYIYIPIHISIYIPTYINIYQHAYQHAYISMHTSCIHWSQSLHCGQPASVNHIYIISRELQVSKVYSIIKKQKGNAIFGADNATLRFAQTCLDLLSSQQQTSRETPQGLEQLPWKGWAWSRPQEQH